MQACPWQILGSTEIRLFIRASHEILKLTGGRSPLGFMFKNEAFQVFSDHLLFLGINHHRIFLPLTKSIFNDANIVS
jgi:hypothetical protein